MLLSFIFIFSPLLGISKSCELETIIRQIYDYNSRFLAAVLERFLELERKGDYLFNLNVPITACSHMLHWDNSTNHLDENSINGTRCKHNLWNGKGESLSSVLTKSGPLPTIMHYFCPPEYSCHWLQVSCLGGNIKWISIILAGTTVFVGVVFIIGVIGGCRRAKARAKSEAERVEMSLHDSYDDDDDDD